MHSSLTPQNLTCFGDGAWGSTGFPTNRNAVSLAEARTSPLTFVQNIESYRVGYRHTCAILTNHDVWCIGAREAGQLGDTVVSTTPSTVLVKAVQVLPARLLAVGHTSTCVVLYGTNDVRCVGGQDHGSLLNGQYGTYTYSTTGWTTNFPLGPVALAGGAHHYCVVVSSWTTLQCWGIGINHQFGQGADASDRGVSPVTVLTTTNPSISQIALAEYSTCVLLSDGTVKCNGFNGYGALGVGFDGEVSVPTTVAALGAAVTQITTGLYHTCFLLVGGQVKCSGANPHYQGGRPDKAAVNAPVLVPTLDSVVAVYAGAFHTCVVRTNQEIRCFGYSANDATAYSNFAFTPQVVPGGPYSDVAVSGNWHDTDGGHTCFIQTDGVLACAGLNADSQLGLGHTTNVAIPTSVSIGGLAAQVALGSFHTCVRLVTSGVVKCFGLNDRGQLGQGDNVTRSVPTTVSLGAASLIASGSYHVCAILTDQKLWCWGLAMHGQVGIPSPPPIQFVPIKTSDGPVTALTCGSLHTCAIISAQLYCWGTSMHTTIACAHDLELTLATCRHEQS